MSEPKLISPMLDDFDMGGPISDHHGVRCCPAMRKNSDEKYIVKIISVPESQTKLDALLLTGAFTDNQSALSYFEELANGIVDEKKRLDSLSQLEGFVSFEDCQIVPMEDAVGYDVYLLSEYRRTLARQNAKRPMTQLEAVNLGLDLCAALSACRRNGYLYVDLKPTNIYIVGDKEYKIGDLGFVRINSLKYESLQDKYRSPYTAPELEDVFAPLNETMDIYAAGMILYQIFNGGTLPNAGQKDANGHFTAPKFADEEMAEIILKACASDPANRWQDPAQMGQAIVSYMQKNGVNDTPLAEEPKPEPPKDEAVEESEAGGSDSEESTSELINIVENLIEELVDESAPVEPEAIEEVAATAEAPVLEYTEEVENTVETTDEISVESENIDSSVNVQADTDEDPANNTNVQETDAAENDTNNEAEEAITDADRNYKGISDEVSDILDQIDALTSHDVPAPVVAPEPIEIKIPDPIIIEENTNSEETEGEESDATEEPVTDSDAADPETEEVSEDVSKDVPNEASEEEMPYVPKKKRTGLVVGIILFIILALLAGGYFFYTEYYLQPIHSLTIEGSEDSLQITVDTDVDEALLTVVCADSLGNKVTAPVVAGKTAFAGLAPDTAYTVSVEVEGLHKLIGTTSKVYSTPVQTKMMQVHAITGSENGSVILSFTVDGPDSDQWNVIYSAEGEAERVSTFADHMITLTGLTVGKEYTFRLEPVSDLYISGESETTYVVRNLICAENLRITSFADGTLTAQWDAPDGEIVDNWSVRCYNGAGYNETVAVEDNMVTFQNLDDSFAYTIEVTAANMSVSQSVSVAANVVTISDFSASQLPNGMLSLTWNANREIPLGGWVLNYSVNGINAAEVITALENTAEINAVPTGSYAFSIYDASGNEVLGGPFTYTLSEADTFSAYGIGKDNITTRLCKTPTEDEWNYENLSDEDYVNAFAVGDKVSAVLALDGSTEESTDTILVTYAIYDESSQLVIFSHSSLTWDAMWENNYCELNVPAVPADAGTYNLIIYFNGAEAGSQKFEITA